MKQINKGSIAVEACLVVPLFLFFMLFLIELYMLLMAEAHIHQSLAEAANYTAQYCYLERKLLSEKKESAESFVNTIVLHKQFQAYLGEDFYVEKVIAGGRKGIILSLIKDRENPKQFTVKADYLTDIGIPVLGEFHIALSNRIKQKAFLGYSKEERADCYVYVTPNQEVYHTSRSCTHLKLSIQQTKWTEKQDYAPCSFCAEGKKEPKEVYVARTSRIYHQNRECIGLKRTVRRVKLGEVGVLGPCQRCGR